MQKQIQIRRSTLIILAAVIVAVVALVVVLQLPPGGAIGGRGATPTPSPADAGVNFTQAFYAVDYRDQQAWLERLKPLATKEGYILVEHNLAPLVWDQLTTAQTVIALNQVQVEDNGLVFEGVSHIGGDKPFQIRALSITLPEALRWPNMSTGTFTTNALLAQEAGQWKFAAFLTDDQAQAYKLSLSASPTPK